MTGYVRLSLAMACAVGIGLAMRGSLGDALVARGDEAVRLSRLPDASRYYQRAESVSGVNVQILDRLVLLVLLAPDGHNERTAMVAADALIAQHSHDATAWFDRGLIEWKTRRYRPASTDFQVAYRLSGERRARAFAAIALGRMRS